ncbi:MAG: hypothetical protein GXO80_12075 [Chlorobi bacterium]|nr:hypothetical protein [Chlorobiota bacterium]
MIQKNEYIRESDQKFKEIEGLKWFPWIGKNYDKIPQKNRLLIIGESHYHDGKIESIKKHKTPYYTRIAIDEFAVNRNYYNIKIYKNLHLCLFGNDEFKSESFWNSVSYYNFVQNVMNTNKGRPNFHDFLKGWTLFFKMIDIINPSICLFVGVESSKSLNLGIETFKNFSINNIEVHDKISGTYPRTTNIYNEKKYTYQTIFMQHTSSRISWKKWNRFLNDKIGNQLNWYRENII